MTGGASPSRDKWAGRASAGIDRRAPRAGARDRAQREPRPRFRSAAIQRGPGLPRRGVHTAPAVIEETFTTTAVTRAGAAWTTPGTIAHPAG